MRYMLMRKADTDTENAVLPTEEILQAMADYNERMLHAGVFVDGNGLRPTREGCRIQFRNGEPTVVRGPFEHTDELLAGYSVLEADSLEDFEPGSALEKHRSMGNLPREMNVHVAFHS